MKKTLLIIMALAGLFLSASVSEVMAQTYYYYDIYTGKKTPITLNENKLVVSIPRDYDEISKRVRANVQALFWTQDYIFEFFFITRSDYEKLTSLDFWEEDAKSVIVTPSYIQDDDKGDFFREIFALPYVIIHLKKEGDLDLLTPYLEKYRLKNDWQGPWSPLSCILCLTLDSEKGPLEIANEMFESGVFSASVPDFAYPSYGSDPNTVRSITTTQQPSSTYDLQGRKLSNCKWSNSQIRKGIYVKDGRKFVVK
ncbi:MAG: hypothetical protein IKW98_10620 [Prevotella sp.]|nr:hypothetical protein [Prevotella sp.]